MATVDSFILRPRYEDSDDRPGTPDIYVAGTPATVSADFLTGIEALIATGFDDGDGGDFTMSGIVSLQLIINIEPAAVGNPTLGDIRDKWKLTFPSGRTVSIPGRSTYGALTTAESQGEFADKTEVAYTDWFAAMFSAPPAGVGAVDPADDSTPASANLEVRATTSRRERPRV